MPSSGVDQAVEHARVLDLVASAKRLDDALNMAAALADVLDEVEIFVVADLLDANEHGWCPSLQSDTMPNPMRSSSKASLLASEDLVLHHSSGQAAQDSPHNYTAPLHEAQSSREQRLLVEQSGKRQHQRL